MSIKSEENKIYLSRDISDNASTYIGKNISPNSIIINTDKISIYDRTLDLIIDLSDIDLNNIKSIIINGITFNNKLSTDV